MLIAAPKEVLAGPLKRLSCNLYPWPASSLPCGFGIGGPRTIRITTATDGAVRCPWNISSTVSVTRYLALWSVNDGLDGLDGNLVHRLPRGSPFSGVVFSSTRRIQVDRRSTSVESYKSQSSYAVFFFFCMICFWLCTQTSFAGNINNHGVLEDRHTPRCFVGFSVGSSRQHQC